MYQRRQSIDVFFIFASAPQSVSVVRQIFATAVGDENEGMVTSQSTRFPRRVCGNNLCGKLVELRKAEVCAQCLCHTILIYLHPFRRIFCSSHRSTLVDQINHKYFVNLVLRVIY